MNDWTTDWTRSSAIGGLRLTDADRTRALKRLDRHRRKGRVDAGEYAERGDAIRSARTYDDLMTVFGDLEPAVRYAPVARGGWGPRPPFPQLPLLILGIVLAATGVVPWLPVLIIGAVLLLFAPWGRRMRRSWAC